MRASSTNIGPSLSDRLPARTAVRHLPNLICLIRLALVWPIAEALQAGEHVPALVMFMAAAVAIGSM